MAEYSYVAVVFFVLRYIVLIYLIRVIIQLCCVHNILIIEFLSDGSAQTAKLVRRDDTSEYCILIDYITH